MLALHFGAGNIGRGFIGQLLHEAGYDICFADVNQTVIDDINNLGKYYIEIVGDEPKRIEITNIEAVNSNDEAKVVEKIVNADIITTALGANILKYIAPVIAKGLLKRAQLNLKPINIIACENMINGSAKLRDLVYEQFNEENLNKVKGYAGFPNAAVDRIVPLQHNDEKLLVKTEAFFEWDVESSAVAGEKPQINGVTYVDNLQAYIERKLFAVNATHASIAYLGYVHDYKTIYEATQDENIMQTVRGVTQETGRLLNQKYGFDLEKHQKYIDMIIARFSSPYISDDIVRVARSPIRKISPVERLTAPAKQLTDRNLPVENLVKVIAAALHFANEHDSEAVQLQAYIKANSVKEAVIKYCGLNENDVLTEKILQAYEEIKK